VKSVSGKLDSHVAHSVACCTLHQHMQHGIGCSWVALLVKSEVSRQVKRPVKVWGGGSRPPPLNFDQHFDPVSDICLKF
jgi:hypothetical protein